MGEGDRRRSLPLAEFPPGEVVEGPQAIGHAPMRHDALGVGFKGLLEASDPFLMVEAEAPVQTEIEPALRLGRPGGDCSGVTSEVEIFHACPVILAPAILAADSGSPPGGWRSAEING